MGTSGSSERLDSCDEKYKLVRRFNSDIYGDVTIIQNKNNKCLYALKEIISEESHTVATLQKRKTLNHKNIVKMHEYWFSGENSICSTIRKIESVYEYYPNTVSDELHRRLELQAHFSDNEIIKILESSLEGLETLKNSNIVHLLAGTKALIFDEKSHTVKIMENCESIAQYGNKIEVNIMAINGYHSNVNNPILSNNSSSNNSKILPLHPLISPKDGGDQFSISGECVEKQNIFVLGLVSLGLCWMKEPIEIGIYTKNGYDFEKIEKRVTQIKSKFPKVYKVLSGFLMQKHWDVDFTYENILSRISSQKRSYSKENERCERIIDIQPIEKVGDRRAKKLSYLREMRLSNNDIPKEF